MTPKAVSLILMEMESLRERSYEAETPQEERRLLKEYKRLWEVVEPFVTSKPARMHFKPFGS